MSTPRAQAARLLRHARRRGLLAAQEVSRDAVMDAAEAWLSLAKAAPPGGLTLHRIARNRDGDPVELFVTLRTLPTPETQESRP